MQARITPPRAGSERRTSYPSGLGSGGLFGGGGVHGFYFWHGIDKE